MSWDMITDRITATIGFVLAKISKCECQSMSSKLDECAKHLRLAVQALQGE